MKLYHRKYFVEDDKARRETNGKQMPVKKFDIEHLINQAIIWIAIVFLAVVIIKKIF